MMAAVTAISLLRDIERRTLESTTAVSRSDAVKVEWRGLSFRIGNSEFVTPLSNVFEVLDPLPCTRVPRSKPWFDGIANVRGTLVPVMDFYAFLYNERKPITNDTRTIIFRLPNSVAGLVVTAIGGLRHFFMDEQISKPPENLEKQFSPYIKKSFQVKDSCLGVFEISNLAVTEAFLKISI